MSLITGCKNPNGINKPGNQFNENCDSPTNFNFTVNKLAVGQKETLINKFIKNVQLTFRHLIYDFISCTMGCELL